MNDRKHILIIDDEPLALEVMSEILKHEGYEVVVAANGEEALDLFRKSPCDLVITDMVMPVKDGLQTILDLRAEAPELPVIAVSGGGNISKDRYLAVAGCMNRVLTIGKPFTVSTLTGAVRQMLEDAPLDQP
ncbi:MAG: response regulator [Deltaproteobacteria bacterium]|nr:MAG: response regulator [Deltaproteobacteria bacterium]